MNHWDVIAVGAGIIGLSLSIELRKHGATVLLVERGEPGREASYAAAGMIADTTVEAPPQFQLLAQASARMYPEFVHELQDESGVDCDLRDAGALVLEPNPSQEQASVSLKELEPSLNAAGLAVRHVKERSVDPRPLVHAALKAARHRGVDVSSGATVTSLLVEQGRAVGVATDRTTYRAGAVVNCAGAWAGSVGPNFIPVRPVKGQILSVVGAPKNSLRHVVRSPEVYLVPRSDGRILIGATAEEAGYDKRTDAATIHRLHDAALHLLPALGQGRMLEDWAGLRPATLDGMPILGATATPGYFVATGHFRDGILLAPVTARVMAQVVLGKAPEQDLAIFSPSRFQA